MRVIGDIPFHLIGITVGEMNSIAMGYSEAFR
jgi:hypothetical protein